MSKRAADFQNRPEKRQRLSEVDAWGDDFDPEAIEDCFLRATQDDPDVRNTTILPSYNTFKQASEKNGFTSTQMPRFPPGSALNLDEICREKDGEISILRANLKQVKDTAAAEQEKRQVEWNARLGTILKENKTIKSELEFKDLQVINLKQTISELKKAVARQDKAGVSKAVSAPVSQVSKTPPEVPVLRVNTTPFQPFRNFDCGTLFTSLVTGDKEYFNLPLNPGGCIKNSIPYLQNQSLRQDVSFRGARCNKNEDISADLSYLINLNPVNLQTKKVSELISRVEKFLHTHLVELYENLREMSRSLQGQQIYQRDSVYFQNNNQANLPQTNQGKHIGRTCGELLRFLAELAPFHKQIAPNFKLILDSVKLIGKTRISEDCTNFFQALLRFISQKPEMLAKSNDIFKEILLSRPDFQTIFTCTKFLSLATKDEQFSGGLCEGTMGTAPDIAYGKGLLYLGPKSCTFYAYSVLFENMLDKMENRDLDVGLCEDILTMVYNIFKSNCHWLYLCDKQQSATKRCRDCLYKLYKLSLQVIYKYLLKSRCTCVKRNHLKSIVQILCLLMANSDILVRQYVTEYAQFKDIVDLLCELGQDQDEQFVGDLRKLNLDLINEEIPVISKSSFSHIDF